ncbi:MAG: Nif3-like dinuclear metal center hexameric protein [Flavobacteriaceae bacterium]|nr:Nif3-like dinuclear metal center hexameric protein [Flavobacteriaceae bacterium]
MTIQDVIQHLEELAPLAYAEEFDNVGLLVGKANTKVTGILITLDTLESIVDEAIENNCNLIVSFHPIIFSGLKKLTGRSYVERVVMKALKNDIAIFAIHTALDNSWNGVNDMICDQLGLINRKILIPQSETIKKLTTYVPNDEAEKLRKSLFEAGAGSIGNYDNCSFNIEGIGTYTGNEDSKPTKGKSHELQEANETLISITYPKHIENELLEALFKAHSYEEIAYEVTTLENKNQHIGMGMIGELPAEQDIQTFLMDVKQKMKASSLRHTAISYDTVKKVAVLGGSGSFAIESAKKAGANVFITADLKYHDFFKAEDSIVLVDIGHYESEQYTKNLLASYLRKKITNFAIVLSTTDTNPVKYL